MKKRTRRKGPHPLDIKLRKHGITIWQARESLFDIYPSEGTLVKMLHGIIPMPPEIEQKLTEELARVDRSKEGMNSAGTIDSGPLEASYRPYMVPPEKWRQLVGEKRSFLHIKIKYDCRCLLEFIDDAEEMWEELGYTSRDDLIVNGYELDPSEVGLAVKWLKIKDPDFEAIYGGAS